MRVFDGIAVLDLCRFQAAAGAVPRACSGVYRVDRTSRSAASLAEVIDRHGYLKKPEDVVNISGSPLVELCFENSIMLACEMILEATNRDPITARLLTNLLSYLANGEKVGAGLR